MTIENWETVFCLTCGEKYIAQHYSASQRQPNGYTRYLSSLGRDLTQCDRCGASMHRGNVSTRQPRELPANFETLVSGLSLGEWYRLILGADPSQLVTAEQSPDQETITRLMHEHRPPYALLLSFAARVLAADLRAYSARLEREQRVEEPDTELQREGYVSGLALLERFVAKKKAELGIGAQ